jgi:PAS domain S-box-containing protein
VSITALRDAQNAIIGYLLIGTDNTARKQAEEALLKAGALQTAIFNSANFSSIATDAKGVIQIFNVGAERMLGYMAADVMNKITPADISDPQEVIARAKALSVELGTPITPGFEALVFKASRGIEDIYELTYIRKDGSRFPAVVSITALRDAQNAIIGYLLIGTDNTARKQVEEERMKLDQRLRDQQFYTRSLFESNIDALMATDPSGIITDVNKQMEVLTGCTRDELIGAPFKNFFTDPELAEAAIKRVLSEKTITDYELTACAKDGKETVVSYNATTFYDRDRTLQGVFAAARDVTERKSANDKLKNALNEKEMLLKEVYHRVKNNLQVVSSLINLQARNVKNEATAELLKQSADRIKAMALLHEKLYQSKDLARIDFNAYIHSLADHLLFGYGVHSDKIRVNIRIDDIFLDVDTAIPCGLIINELLSNALEHAFPDNRHGEIGITFTQDQGKFILVISDNGVSFPADLDYKKSASLGLQLVATLTNQLNGHMTLDRKDGSTFTISFTNTY